MPQDAGVPLQSAVDPALEDATRETARHIFSLMHESRPSRLSQERWQSEMMDWTMDDERLKVEMFRFIDVFPTLRSGGDIARHLREYFLQVGVEPPRILRWALGASGPHSPLLPIAATAIRRQMLAMARRFIVGRDARAALRDLELLRDRGLGFTLDVLGEASVSEVEAATYQARYLELLDTLATQSAGWPDVPVVDRAAWGPLPKVNVSIKVTSLYSQIDPLDDRGSIAAVKLALRPIFRKAAQTGAFLNLDLEQFRYRDLTYAAFVELLDEPEFHDFEHAGIVVQAYLRDAERDLRSLIDWARSRGRTVTVRLVKGAYWDYETVLARQEGWPLPVFTHKADADATFERLARVMLEAGDAVHPAFASHNVRSLAAAIATARHLGLPDDAFEIQMLHGMGAPVKMAVQSLGLRLREYTPVGEIIPGMAYLVRRLLENTANESFLRQTFVDHADVERLVTAPQPSAAFGAAPERLPRVRPTDAGDPGPFRNQPHADFSRDENRRAAAAAIEIARRGLGRDHKLRVGVTSVRTARTITSTNPARPAEIVGVTACAGADEAVAAVAAARQAFSDWRDTPARERAAVLFRAAETMRRELHELAALQMFEAGKTYREADADVGEAIDFLEYYGREMIRLDPPRRMGDLPGEVNEYIYQPRGVAVVLAPWNFPLAIPAGMAAAALVAGNAVVLKPAEQTPVIGAELVRILREAGAPDGVINYLPGYGEDAGETLVCHPDVDLIAFTGSREVGQHIVSQAAQNPGRRWVKRVIAEMGGKNAIIVDDDADLDVAVLETVASAFNHAGQKCSACSRVIVLKNAHDEFVERLVEAARSLAVGPPEDPGTRIGPVIDADARMHIEEYIAAGRREATPALATHEPAEGWPDGGHYVGPHIFTNVDPGAVIAQEEIFGPVLAVLKARDIDEALTIAQDSSYALTGGLISRSPATIARVRRDFRVGNLYINRGITGAMVDRQPFGGFRLSGVGSKAGGPDYLLQFMEPRTVTENTLRRGFAPPERPEAAPAASERP
jgi:RHH-type transcriptional regulator, proline utilization regulon repressor / proline dehydrogenase / delta 1-pyrroline-5-carboxylate dehydrogenase